MFDADVSHRTRSYILYLMRISTLSYRWKCWKCRRRYNIVAKYACFVSYLCINIIIIIIIIIIMWYPERKKMMYRKWGEYRTKVTEDPHHSLCGCMAKASSNTQASTFVCIRHTLTPKRGGAAARRRGGAASILHSEGNDRNLLRFFYNYQR